MDNAVYCSTGAFIGRINGRNHRLLLEYGGALDCDGFEVMIFEDWYDHLGAVINDIRAGAAACPVIHSDKSIGDTSDGADRQKTLDIWKMNCEFGAAIGAKRVVAHIWGYPDSDGDREYIYERCGVLKDIAAGYNLDLLVENVVCRYKNPLTHLEALARIYPDIGFIIDTRHMQFHEEAGELYRSHIWTDGNVRHIHINDYAGGYMNWDKLHPILQPGKGAVDFAALFRHLAASGYAGSLTLEAPSMLADGVDTATLNAGLGYIRRGLRAAGNRC